MQIATGSQTRSAAISTSGQRGFRLRGAALAMLCAASVGCATTATAPNERDVRRLAEVSAIAGKPVSSFHFLSLSSYEPIGDSDVMVFTSPRSAWLLHLYGPCRDLDFGAFIALTSTFDRVSTGFDKVIVRGNPIPCPIQQIRPVDTVVLRHAERERRLQAQPPADQPTSGQPPSG